MKSLKPPITRLAPLFLTAAICLPSAVTGCSKKESPVPVRFDVHIESASGDETAATPLVIRVKGKTKHKKVVDQLCMLWPDVPEAQSIELVPGTYDIEYISPINSDGSIYTVEGDDELVLDAEKSRKSKKNDEDQAQEAPAVSLKPVPASDVTPDMLQDTVDQLTDVLKDADTDSDESAISSNKDEQIDQKALDGILAQAVDIADTRKIRYEAMEKAANSFVRALETPEHYAQLPNSSSTPGSSISWSYAVTSLSEDQSLCLLLNAHEQSSFGMMDYLYVGIPDADGEDFHILNGDRPIQYGVAGAGGFRGSLTTDGAALYYEAFIAGTGNGQETKYVIADGALSETMTWEGNIFERGTQENGTERTPLALTPSWNKKHLYDVLAKQGGGSHLWDLYQNKRMSETSEIQYTGTIRLFDNDDALCAFQGTRNPNPGNRSQKYVVLELDGPTPVTAHNGDGRGSSTREAKLLLLDTTRYGTNEDLPAYWSEYKDKHVTVRFNEMGWFPSDTRLPLGEPSFTSVTDIFEN